MKPLDAVTDLKVYLIYYIVNITIRWAEQRLNFYSINIPPFYI